MKLVNRFCSFLDAVATAMEAKSGVCVILAAWVFFVATGIRAQHRLFWYDELLTVYICALPRMADVWHALLAGIDLNPPFQYLAVRGVGALFGTGHMATRLPMLVAFLLMSVCVFLYLRRRVPAGWALAAMMFPWLTDAYRFSLDARPYGILLGAAGAALFCWSKAAEPNRPAWAPAGLALSLSVALLTHCYAVLLAIPLLAGEAVRLWERRRPDWLLWTVMAVSAFPLAIYPALMAANPAAPVKGFSPFHVTIWMAPGAYRELLEPMFWPLVLVVLAVALAGKNAPARDRGSMPSYELAALAGFAAIPIFAVLLSAATTGTFSLRYGIPGVIGIGCLMAWTGARWSSRNGARSGAAVALLFFVFFAGGLVNQLWSALHPADVQAAEVRPPTPQSAPTPPTVQVLGHPLLSLASGNTLPVVIASGMTFLEVDHYGDDALRARTYYLTDPAAALRRTGSAWFDTTYPTVKRMLHLRVNVEPADAFLARQRQFLLYCSGYVVEWLLPELLARGWHVQLLAKTGAAEIMQVTAPDRETPTL